MRASRTRLAAFAGLRWLRIGEFDLAVPAAAVLTVIGFAGQLADTLGPPVAVPFVLAWAVLAGGGLAGLAAARRSAGLSRALDRAGLPAAWPVVALIVLIVSGWLVFDLLTWQRTNQLYDFDVYLGSAGRWMDGGQPYMTAPESAWPASPANDYFLYPPLLLPFFGLLSRLPGAPVAVVWVAFLIVCAWGAFRAFGLRPLWSLALLAFPPLAAGFEAGNVAPVALLLFALGYRAGGGLVVAGLLKVQLGLPALWLVRTRRRRSLGLGLAVVAAVALATLPIVGLHSWSDWLAGLGYRSQSQPAVISLYGFSVARIVPGWAFAALAVLAVAVSLAFRDRRGLAALGLASIIASPALWPHGFAFALPAVLLLESGAAVWLVLGAGAVGADVWLLFYVGWLAVLAAPRAPDALHPMAGTAGPWPRPAASPRLPGPPARIGPQGSHLLGSTYSVGRIGRRYPD